MLEWVGNTLEEGIGRVFPVLKRRLVVNESIKIDKVRARRIIRNITDFISVARPIYARGSIKI